ncbi:hypothetical protein BC940DRAFT_311090 [Gongronella butleri]|nr:hypothetical protein BC940DRAFT_311090 [Gongronella butleri]
MLSQLILAATALVASSFTAEATMAPSYPSPGTTWKEGQQYTILWADDGTSPSIAQGWKSFKIDFMTGDNNNQTFLENVASNLDGTAISNYTWTAPAVNPHSAIYFFMFTNSAGQMAWTTRFGITGADGQLTAPAHATQPTGEKIPWGTGALVAGGASNSTASSAAASSAPASSSAAASGSASVSSSGSAAAASSSTKSGAATLTRPVAAGVAVAAVAAGLLL